MSYQISSGLPENEQLDIRSFSQLFENMSECYKLFWFNAIVNHVIQGKHRMTYDALINDMIAEAWYMVSEYKLNLGPADGLELLIKYINNETEAKLKTGEKKDNIISYLEKDGQKDKNILKQKKTLTLNVPYRLQSPFLCSMKGREGWKGSPQILADRINQHQRLIYYFNKIDGMNSEIEIEKEWFEYITTNQVIIKGWIHYNMIEYLQRRNPNVPGIINKLDAPQMRNLVKVQNFWKLILQVEDVREIYGDLLMTSDDLSIDHFVPWSYVTHDELWNLSPTTRSINSSKSNNLPKWDIYFPKLGELQFKAYDAIWKYEKVHDNFEKCRKEHINSDEAYIKLYRKGLSKVEFCGNLEEIIYPVYKSAHSMGFKEWKYEG